MDRVARWYALREVQPRTVLCPLPEPHWYSHVEGIVGCPLCRYIREQREFLLVDVQRENMPTCIYVPLRADSLVCDEDMDAAEAVHQTPRGEHGVFFGLSLGIAQRPLWYQNAGLNRRQYRTVLECSYLLAIVKVVCEHGLCLIKIIVLANGWQKVCPISFGSFGQHLFA